MAEIILRNINKTYARGAVPAVKDLTLEIAKSEFLCLLGSSGCGKTTTLRMIAGLEFPTRGEILIGSKQMVSTNKGVYVPAEQRGVGLVFQNYALWPHMNIEQNIEFGLKLRKIARSERSKSVNEVMEKLNIADYRHRLPAQLSGGQQQRVALARMLVLQPQVILLDEPLSNLDAKLRLEMRAELKKLHQATGATIVFVTHDQWEAMTLATTIAIMNEGALSQVGTPEDIYERPVNHFVAEFMGNPPINFINISDKNRQLIAHLLGARDDGVPHRVATIGIRPETVRFDAFASNRGSRGKIIDILSTGGNWIVELEAEGEKIFASTDQRPQYSVDDQIGFHLDPKHIHLFDHDGRRIDNIVSARENL